ncbi:MAG: Ig-like domain-containing protein [Myxococcales bacterium]|nr:Ig-like domain-containing protein [Myxococcales bacterium]
MRTPTLLAASIAALLACGKPVDLTPDGGPGSGSGDITPPRILATMPPTGASQVAATAPLSIEFSEPLDPARLNVALDPPAALGSPSWAFQDTLVTLTPATPLAYFTAYSATVSGTDRAGLSLSGDTSFQFTTETPPDITPPRITFTVPGSGATGVSLGTSVSITFSKPMDVGSLSVALTPAAALGAPGWDASGQTVTFAPKAALVPATSYTVAVGGRDSRSLELPAGAGFSFVTESVADTTKPKVESTSPSGGSTDVPYTSNVSVLFSEPMLRAATEAAFSSNPQIACIFSWDPTSTRLTCTPSSLSGNTLYRVGIGTGARDIANNPLEAAYSFTFTTGIAPDNTPPTIASSNPADGATGVVPETTIAVTFSEPMDQVATMSAFSITSPAGVTGSFAWSGGGTTLTFTPTSNYTLGAIVGWTVGGGAKDLAGNALAASSRTFRVANLASRIIYSSGAQDGHVFSSGGVSSTSVAIRAGDASTGDGCRGFLSFDISTLPANLVRIEASTLYVYQTQTLNSPYTLGSLSAESVFYGPTLDPADYSTPVLNGSTWVISSSATAGLKSASVTSKVQDDWVSRFTRGGLSQFRLAFPLTTNANGLSDFAYFSSGEATSNRPYLYVRYLVP